MKFAAVLALTAAVSSAIDLNDLEFMNYLSKYGKQYTNLEEFLVRKELFMAIALKIAAHNSQPSNFILGHNKFSDFKPEEMQMMLGDKSGESNAECLAPPSGEVTYSEADAPDSVNWVEAGMTTPVKDQGSCGSCWSFATMETVESANAIFGSGLVTLSEQQLVDCEHINGDAGCNGGMTYNAYTYLCSHNAYLEEDYPYTATDTTCTYEESEASDIYLSTYVCVYPQSPAGMRPAVAQQPVAISIDASSDVFHNYAGGVLDSTDCGLTTNHAVAIVGYGTDEASGLEYWLVRNSWGSDWGVDGFIKIAVTEGEGICAINNRPLYPTVA